MGGNYLRDIKGLFTLAPLGLRMFARGKFSLLFEPLEGGNEVRALIERVQAETR